MDRLRSRSCQQTRSDKAIPHREESVENADGLPDEKTPSVEKQLMRDQMSSCVHDYINTLPKSYRTVVILSEIEGLTNQEIAEVLDVTVDTVKIRLHRGRAMLKEKLRNGCTFDRDEDNVLVCDPKSDRGRSR
jgi:RNA polymerase sigma-70 factor (ECF subfamily)